MHKYTAGSTSSGDKISKLCHKTHCKQRMSPNQPRLIKCNPLYHYRKNKIFVHTVTNMQSVAINLLNILHNIEVAFIFPFSSSSCPNVLARCIYGAGCPLLQHAANVHQCERLPFGRYLEAKDINQKAQDVEYRLQDIK